MTHETCRHAARVYHSYGSSCAFCGEELSRREPPPKRRFVKEYLLTALVVLLAFAAVTFITSVDGPRTALEGGVIGLVVGIWMFIGLMRVWKV